jgi:hypothetical protein
MAQTITQQKGSVSTTWDNSISTLFTLSSGTASRVILNSLTANNDAGNNTAYIWFYIYNSSMGVRNPIAGAVAIGSGLAWAPGNTSGPAAYSNSGYAYNNGSMILDVSGSGGSVGSKNPGNLYWTAPASTYHGSYFPAQFWMGNGDSLQVKGYWGGLTGAVYYSFTLVTES